MADQAAKDAAAQQRIVNHMQADHHDSVSISEIPLIFRKTQTRLRLSATSNITAAYLLGPLALAG